MSKVVSVALKEVGYSEYPFGSNKTKYGRWFGLDGVPWCGIFVSWCYDRAGHPLGRIGFDRGFAGCQYAVRYFTMKGKVTETPKEGDIVFFDWNGDGRFDHAGIFLYPVGKSHFMTVEGNTSLKNQSNGGSVMKRMRRFGKGVVFVRP